MEAPAAWAPHVLAHVLATQHIRHHVSYTMDRVLLLLIRAQSPAFVVEVPSAYLVVPLFSELVECAWKVLRNRGHVQTDRVSERG